MNRPNSLGWWWFKGDYYKEAVYAYDEAYWEGTTTPCYVESLSDDGGVVRIGSSSFALYELRGTWEKAQLPSWENGDVR